VEAAVSAQVRVNTDCPVIGGVVMVLGFGTKDPFDTGSTWFTPGPETVQEPVRFEPVAVSLLPWPEVTRAGEAMREAVAGAGAGGAGGGGGVVQFG